MSAPRAYLLRKADFDKASDWWWAMCRAGRAEEYVGKPVLHAELKRAPYQTVLRWWEKAGRPEPESIYDGTVGT